jgi:hypothetical protein
MNAVVPTLKPGGRITLVAWPLPAEVATDDDIDARSALFRVLAHAAQADGDDTVVRVLGSSTSPEDIALAALGKESSRPASVEGLSAVSYADWRVELLGLQHVES